MTPETVDYCEANAVRDYFHVSDGYLRIGTELFMRITPSRKTAEKHIRRLSEHSPETGTIRVIKMTEMQYDNIWYLTGSKDIQEETIGRNAKNKFSFLVCYNALVSKSGGRSGN